MCEVQGEGNVVYSDVCVCEVQGEKNVPVQLSAVEFVLECEFR